MKIEAKMSQWIAKQADRDDVLDRLVLQHVQADGKKGSEVATFKVLEVGRDPDAVAAAQTPDALALKLTAAAEQDAAALGGTQRYMVKAYMLNEERERGRFMFRVSIQEEDEDSSRGEIMSEPPDTRGLTSQLMRHNEALMRMATMSTMHQMEMQARIIAKQEETISDLVSEKMSTIEAIEELRSRKHERDMLSRKEDAALEDKRQILDGIKMLLPSVVNKLAGGRLLPEKKSPEMMALDAFFESLTSEQLATIMGTLNHAQQTVVADILQRRLDEQERERAEKAAKEASKGN